jgi:hypothetical protein
MLMYVLIPPSHLLGLQRSGIRSFAMNEMHSLCNQHFLLTVSVGVGGGVTLWNRKCGGDAHFTYNIIYAAEAPVERMEDVDAGV